MARQGNSSRKRDIYATTPQLKRFTDRLSETYAHEYADEATLGERFKMMGFHLMVMGAIFIMNFIITQWLLGQVVATMMPPPMTASQAMSQMMTVNLVALAVACLSITALALSSRTPFSYLAFNARVVHAGTLGEITLGQAIVRIIIKTLAFLITPLALFYFINHRGTNIVDHWTGTRVVIFRKVLVEGEEGDEAEQSGESDPDAKQREPVHQAASPTENTPSDRASTPAPIVPDSSDT